MYQLLNYLYVVLFLFISESVRARLRILVRRILKKYKYPPDKADEAIELVLEQTEMLSHQWS